MRVRIIVTLQRSSQFLHPDSKTIELKNEKTFNKLTGVHCGTFQVQLSHVLLSVSWIKVVYISRQSQHSIFGNYGKYAVCNLQRRVQKHSIGTTAGKVVFTAANLSYQKQ